GPDEHRLGDPPGALAGDVPGHLPAAGRVANMDCVTQVQSGHQRREIVGVGVHVVAVPRLAGPAVAAAVIGHAPEPAGSQEKHLVLPGVRGQWPTVAEDDRLAGAPVFEVDSGAVLRGDRVHGLSPRLGGGWAIRWVGWSPWAAPARRAQPIRT